MGAKTAEQVTDGIDASELTIIVTGGTSGLGKETVRVLAKRGAHVYLAARNLSAADKVKKTIVKETPSARIDLLKVDLASLEAVRTAAQEFLALNVPLNVLVNNAGMFGTPPLELSPDGIELVFATNYLGHALFTHLLLDKLKETASESGVEGRIVNVSSKGYELWAYEVGIRFDHLYEQDQKGRPLFNNYGQSKLAQILHTKELAKHLKDEGANITVNALHPGFVSTNITGGAGPWIKPFIDLFTWLFFANLAQGAATQTYLAISPDVQGVTGKYFDNMKEAELKDKHALDEELQVKLWDFTMKMITD